MFKNLISLILLTILLVGCDASIKIDNRSGTTDDDNIEEPLSRLSLKYKNALETSNAIIELIKDKKFEKVASDYFSNDAKINLRVEDLKKSFTQTTSAVGSIKRYKQMQWGFLSKPIEKQSYIYSIKIVEHEKASLNYYFVFVKDSTYTKIVGLSVKIRKRVRPVGQFE
jgi:predicted DNA binding CopG/RHH family protein